MYEMKNYVTRSYLEWLGKYQAKPKGPSPSGRSWANRDGQFYFELMTDRSTNTIQSTVPNLSKKDKQS